MQEQAQQTVEVYDRNFNKSIKLGLSDLLNNFKCLRPLSCSLKLYNRRRSKSRADTLVRAGGEALRKLKTC